MQNCRLTPLAGRLKLSVKMTGPGLEPSVRFAEALASVRSLKEPLKATGRKSTRKNRNNATISREVEAERTHKLLQLLASKCGFLCPKDAPTVFSPCALSPLGLDFETEHADNEPMLCCRRKFQLSSHRKKWSCLAWPLV